MIKLIELALAIIALGGVGGVGNQFFVLIILGIVSRSGHLHIPDEFAFMQSAKFLVPVTVYWLVTLLAELGLTPHFMVGFVRKVSYYLNTRLAPAFGAVMALLSVGFVTHCSEQFRDVSSLIQLLSPGELLSANSSFGMVVAILAGTIGAAILSLLFATLSYAVNVSLYEENGGNKTFSPIFDNGSVLIALTAIYFLKDTNPWVICSVLLLFLGLLVYLVTSIARKVFAIVDHVTSRPMDGLLLLLDFFIWGRGGAIAGEPKANRRTKRLISFWLLYAVFTFGLFVVPILELLLQPIMISTYLYCSRRSAQSLWKFFKLKERQAMESRTMSFVR